MNQLIEMSNHRLLKVIGPDAEKFLQGQCTCDLRKLERNTVLHGGHCNPKGRLISSFTLAKLGDDAVGLRVRADIVDSAVAALKKYIVFSKAEIEVSDHKCLSVLHSDIESLPLNSFLVNTVPELGTSSGTPENLLLRHSQHHLELWGGEEQYIQQKESLLSDCNPADAEEFDRLLIENGLVEINAKLTEKYLPHELNYQLTGAISFDKGCYTGQEIIARMQYRGQLKKHCFLASSDHSKQFSVGDPIVSPDTPEKHLGVVIASYLREGKSLSLILTNAEYFLNKTPLIEKNSKSKISWLQQPYAIP